MARLLKCNPLRGRERIEQKLAGLSNFNPTKKKFLDRTNYYGQQVEMDGQGRLLLPQLLRETGQIKGEVAVLGNLTFLTVRNLELFKREIEEDKFTPDDTRRRSTNWASPVGEGSTDTPVGVGHGGGREARAIFHQIMFRFFLKGSDRLFKRAGVAGSYIDATVGLGGHSYEISKTPRRTGTWLDWPR